MVICAKFIINFRTILKFRKVKFKNNASYPYKNFIIIYESYF